jgi:hypothetical protein
MAARDVIDVSSDETSKRKNEKFATKMARMRSRTATRFKLRLPVEEEKSEDLPRESDASVQPIRRVLVMDNVSSDEESARTTTSGAVVASGAGATSGGAVAIVARLPTGATEARDPDDIAKALTLLRFPTPVKGNTRRGTRHGAP